MPEICPLRVPKAGRPVFNKNNELWLVSSDAEFGKKLAGALLAAGYKATLVLPTAENIPENLAALLVVADGGEPPLALMRRAIPILQKNGAADGALLVGISRMDGAFGFNNLTSMELAFQAAITGIVKSLSYELPEVTCRAIDVDYNWQDDQSFKMIGRALCQGLPLEVGLAADGASQLVLGKSDQDIVTPWVPEASEVIVISGGARGVTAQIARQFAANGAKLILLGRSPLPEALPAWCQGLKTVDEIKKAVLANTTEKLTPKMLEQKARPLAAAAEILATIATCRQNGALVEYHALDVRETAAVAEVLAGVKAKYGPITMLVHGAGVLSDAYFVNKKDEDYQKVFGTKVIGFKNLLAACDDNLKRIVLFSSTTARLGRKGQSDYAAANEVLNKIAQSYARTHKNCTVKAMGWGPWAGGMVNSGLARLFAEEGIGLIGLEDGARLLARELQLAGPVEIAILGIDSLLPAELFVPCEPELGPEDEYLELKEMVISCQNQPILAAHKLAGQYVVPFALVMEWFLEAGAALAKNRVIAEISDVQMLNGLKVAAAEELPAQIRAKELANDRYLIEIVTERKGMFLPAYRAEILLADKLAAAEKAALKVQAAHKVSGKLADVYKKYLFHGPALQAFGDKPALAVQGAKVNTHGSKPQTWLNPAPEMWAADPLLLDVAFQLAIVWSTVKEGAPCLPARCASFRQFAANISRENVMVEIQLVKKSGSTLIFDIEWSAGDQLLARMDGYEAVMNESLIQAFKKR